MKCARSIICAKPSQGGKNHGHHRLRNAALAPHAVAELHRHSVAGPHHPGARPGAVAVRLARAFGVEIVSALYHLFPKEFNVDKTVDLLGSQDLLNEIKEGRDPKVIALHWQKRLNRFRNLRSKYLLY